MAEKETIEFLLLAAMQQYMVVMVMTLSTPVNPVIQLISRGLFWPMVAPGMTK